MPVDEPTAWCGPIVVAPKRSCDDIRVCVDLRKLNRSVKRERYILPTFEDIAAKLQSCVFSKLDAANAYHQLPLDGRSARLTTFITPMGRFCFKRLPFGISLASEIDQKRMEDLLSNINRVAVNQDNVIVGGVDDEDHDQRLAKVEAILDNARVELNRPKCVYRVPELIFHGSVLRVYRLTPQRSKPSLAWHHPQTQRN